MLLYSNLFKKKNFVVIDAMQSAYSDAIGAPKIPSVTWEDVGGLVQLKNEIIRSLKSSQFSSGLHRSGRLHYVVCVYVQTRLSVWELSLIHI